MSYNPKNPNGQATSANSDPVVIASDQSAVPISATSLPLPTGAATSADQTNGSQKTQIVDGSGNVVSSTSNALNVNVTSGSSVELTDGTNTANVLAPGTANSTGNAVLTAATSQTVTFSTTTAQAVASTDVGNYSWFSVTLNTTGTNSVNTFQASNDNVNWSSLMAVSTASAQGVTNTINTAGANESGPLTARYFRINVTGITAGTTAGTVAFFTTPRQLATTSVAQEGTWLVGSSSATGSTVPTSAFYVGMDNSAGDLAGLASMGAVSDTQSGNSYLAVGHSVYNGSTFDRARSANSATGTTGTGLLGAGAMGIYNSSAPSTSSGDYYQLQLDSSANLKVNVAASSGLTVSLNPSTSGGWSVSSQTALTNTVVYPKTSAGQFGGYMFYNPNSAVMYIQVFNAASGVSLGSTAPTYVIPIPAAASANIEFANGIAHATGIGVAATTTATGSTAPTTALTGFVIYK